MFKKDIVMKILNKNSYQQVTGGTQFPDIGKPNYIIIIGEDGKPIKEEIIPGPIKIKPISLDI